MCFFLSQFQEQLFELNLQQLVKKIFGHLLQRKIAQGQEKGKVRVNVRCTHYKLQGSGQLANYYQDRLWSN